MTPSRASPGRGRTERGCLVVVTPTHGDDINRSVETISEAFAVEYRIGRVEPDVNYYPHTSVDVEIHGIMTDIHGMMSAMHGIMT